MACYSTHCMLRKDTVFFKSANGRYKRRSQEEVSPRFQKQGDRFVFLEIRWFCGQLILPWVPPRALSEVEPPASLARDNPLAEATTSHTGSEPATLGNDVDVLPIMPSVAGSEC